MAADQPQGTGAQGQGAAHRRLRVLGPDAPESRRQAARDTDRKRQPIYWNLLADCQDGQTREISDDGEDEERIVSRVFSTAQFGYRKITVERPLRLNFQASAERIERLSEQTGFQNLAKSKKRGEAGAKEEAEGRALQQAIRTMLKMMPDTLYKDREVFLKELAKATRKAELKLPAPAKKAILVALSERDETAEICRDKDGAPEPDPELRDTERVPLAEGEDPVDGDGSAGQRPRLL